MKKIFVYSFIAVIVAVLFFVNLIEAITINNPLEHDTFGELIEAVIGLIFGLAIVLAPLMVLVAAFYFITAAGNPDRIQKAKDIITYTVIGLAIAMLAKTLIQVLEDLLKTKTP